MIRICGGLLRRRGSNGMRCLLIDSGIGNGEVRGLCASSGGKIDKMVEPAAGAEGMTKEEAYRKIHDLDFTTAAKILFTAAPDKKKFGLDFHLVQLFFACLPSLAVYLVAQYARYEIRIMEAEVEVKKKAEEEEKAKRAEEEEREKKAEEEAFGREMEMVKGRLEALEEVVKEIAVESKKTLEGNMAEKSDIVLKKEEAPPALNPSACSSGDAPK